MIIQHVAFHELAERDGPRRMAPGTRTLIPYAYALSTGTWISVTYCVGSLVSPGLRR
jgi:hypothetical protein